MALRSAVARVLPMSRLGALNRRGGSKRPIGSTGIGDNSKAEFDARRIRLKSTKERGWHQMTGRLDMLILPVGKMKNGPVVQFFAAALGSAAGPRRRSDVVHGPGGARRTP